MKTNLPGMEEINVIPSPPQLIKENHSREINLYSYWEHFNYAKYLSLIFPLESLKRKRIEEELNSLLQKLKEHEI